MAAFALPSRPSFTSVLRGLLSSSSLTRRNPFEAFGPAAKSRSSGMKPKIAARRAVQDFSITEARRRLKLLFDAAVRISTPSALEGLLNGNMLRLEARAHGKSRPVTYIIDTISQKRVLASAVDRRLSFRSLQQRFGLGRVYPRPVTREERIAANYRQAMLSFMPGKPGARIFSDWSDLYYTMPTTLRGSSYVERNGVGYIGRVEGRCPETHKELVSMIEQARRDGKRLIVPGKPVPGAPILDATFSTRAELVHPSLKATALNAAFGHSMSDHFEKLNRTRANISAQSPGPTAKSVDMADFKRRFIRTNPAPVPQLTSDAIKGYGFGGALSASELDPERLVIRQKVDALGREEFVVWDRDANQEVPIDLKSLPAGSYQKDDDWGLPSGGIVIGEDGEITHLNLRGEIHNDFGAAVVPPATSQRPKVWAINGQKMSQARFREAARELRDHGDPVAMTSTMAAVTEFEDAEFAVGTAFAP